MSCLLEREMAVSGEDVADGTHPHATESRSAQAAQQWLVPDSVTRVPAVSQSQVSSDELPHVDCGDPSSLAILCCAPSCAWPS